MQQQNTTDAERERARQNWGKRAIRYGCDILMMADRKIERWPTIARAQERISELAALGYFAGSAPPGDSIRYHEWLRCGPAQHCGVEYVRSGRTQEDPGEVSALPYSDPDAEVWP